MPNDKARVESVDNELKEFTINIRCNRDSGTYPIILSAIQDFDIISADFQTDAGTIDVHFEIDDVDVEFSGGDETLSASTTAGQETATSANSVSAGSTVNMLLANAASSPTLISVDLRCRKT